jgi:hypothetical protein
MLNDRLKPLRLHKSENAENRAFGQTAVGFERMIAQTPKRNGHSSACRGSATARAATSILIPLSPRGHCGDASDVVTLALTGAASRVPGHIFFP